MMMDEDIMVYVDERKWNKDNKYTMKLLQCINLFTNMKNWANLETNDIFLGKQWKCHKVKCMVLMNHDRDGDNVNGDGE